MFALYADILLMDGTWVYGVQATFANSVVNTWQFKTVTTNTGPINEIYVYCLFRNMKGTVYFDNVYVGVGSGSGKRSVRHVDADDDVIITTAAAAATKRDVAAEKRYLVIGGNGQDVVLASVVNVLDSLDARCDYEIASEVCFFV